MTFSIFVLFVFALLAASLAFSFFKYRNSLFTYIFSVVLGYTSITALTVYYTSIETNSILFTGLFMSCFAAFILLSTYFVINYFLIKPIDNVLDHSKKIADGDLSIDFEKSWCLEINQISEAIENIKNSLGGLVKNIGESSSTLASTSEEMAAITREMNSSVIQTSQMIKQLSEGSQNTSESVNKTNEEGKNVRTLASNVSDKFRTIISNINRTADVIKDLNNKSKQIEIIVEVISSIAAQTNLLSLNAAIEAARAGEHGKGFAVVAEEIRKLADGSKKSATQISDLISEIMKISNETVISIENSASLSTEGQSMLEITMTSVDSIMSEIDSISSIVEENSSASTEADASIKEQVSGMEELTSSAKQLTEMARDFETKVEQYYSKIKEKADLEAELA